MMRSLWTGAAGMTAQQTNVDVISNNISNVNTTGYKSERAEFQSLLYQTLDEPAPASGSTMQTEPMQVGHGAQTSAIQRNFNNGSLQSTSNTFDFALNGSGFFSVLVDGEIQYTKDGSFKTSIGEDDGNLYLVTTDGYPVLDTNEEPITFPSDSDVIVDASGNFYGTGEDGNDEELGVQFAIYQFVNPNGLEAEGNNLYGVTSSSGEPILEATEEVRNTTSVYQGFIEMSNVDIAEEMVNLIVAQRAYEMNSKTITTSDEMLQTASTLKR